MAQTKLDRLLERFRIVSTGGVLPEQKGGFATYAVTNFRGGIGKSTLAFNLAWEMSRKEKTLLLDVCPQCNFTQSLLGEGASADAPTIYDALLPHVMAGTPVVNVDDLLVSVPPACPSFKQGAGAYVVPGSKDLFLFPSLLYTQLSAAANLGSRSAETSRSILQAVGRICVNLREHLKADKVLIDTSPFFGGATHLAWVAADALIIPVRVDQHSIEALKLTLSILRQPDMDFNRLNRQAGITKIPTVHAIAMTHCGWNRQSPYTPDRSTQSYLSAVIDIVEQNADLFSNDNPIDCIHLLDDFHAAGRISGTKRIPLAKLHVRESYLISGQKLEVNESIECYQKEMRALALTL